ncbi:DUF4269 domain-containing protein [Curvivirga aplysinae]|uniref:DUF4269 domain-containing protein n=1 Tax=Curvivirga aplysinae TaxID=2529852 RepID=UPI0012BC063C|nr:DUF4269 domain-containing protein [Curvivirga aplysinae]MTI11291.1 DUF4269 domain-containing protein [Curvivirga aplysinae]
MKSNYQTALSRLNLLEILKEFTPAVIGTPPLDIEIELSDIDIACYTKDLDGFQAHLNDHLGHLKQFQSHRYIRNQVPTVLTSFHAYEWEFEIFCQNIPVCYQWGVRHFHVEQRLLSLRPSLRKKVINLKQQGIKTEPAFAQILGLTGDPYQAIVDLETLSDEDLLEFLNRV